MKAAATRTLLFLLAFLLVGPCLVSADTTEFALTVEDSSGRRLTLDATDFECTPEGELVHCRVRPNDEVNAFGFSDLEVEASAVGEQAVDAPVLASLAFGLMNVAAVPIAFTTSLVVPVAETPGAVLASVSAGGAVSDSSFDGSGGMMTNAGLPLVRGLIDGAAVASLHPAPLLIPGPAFPGSFAFAGEVHNIPAAASSDVMTTAPVFSVAIQNDFQLDGGDSIAMTNLFVVRPAMDPAVTIQREGGPAITIASSDLACEDSAAGSRCSGRELPPPAGEAGVWELSDWDLQAISSPATAAGIITLSFGLRNVSAVPVAFTNSTVVPIGALGASTVGGSVGGAVTDSNFDGVGGLQTSSPSPFFAATIDGVALSPTSDLHPDPFFVPGPAFPGAFDFPGQTRIIPATSFGLPGPAAAGPAITTSIGIETKYTLAPGDSIAVTALFVVSEGTPVPTATSTASPTATATPTNTLIPQGGSCAAAPGDCAPDLSCVDDVCCDTSCDGPLEQCNLSGFEGTCTSTTAPAPAASSKGLLIAFALLISVGALALFRRRNP